MVSKGCTCHDWEGVVVGMALSMEEAMTRWVFIWPEIRNQVSGRTRGRYDLK